MTPASLAGTVGSKKSVEALVGKFSQPGAFSSMAVPTAQFAKEKPTTRKRKATPWEERQNAVRTITVKNSLGTLEDQRLVESFLYIHRKTGAGQRISPIASKAEAPAYQVTQDAINRAMRMSKTPEGRAKMAAEVAEFRAQRQRQAVRFHAKRPTAVDASEAAADAARARQTEDAAAREEFYREQTGPGIVMSRSIEPAERVINEKMAPIVGALAKGSIAGNPVLGPLAKMFPGLAEGYAEMVAGLPGPIAMSIPRGLVDVASLIDPRSEMPADKRMQFALGAVVNLGLPIIGAKATAAQWDDFIAGASKMFTPKQIKTAASPRLSIAQRLQARAASADVSAATAPQPLRGFQPQEAAAYDAGEQIDILKSPRLRPQAEATSPLTAPEAPAQAPGATLASRMAETPAQAATQAVSTPAPDELRTRIASIRTFLAAARKERAQWQTKNASKEFAAWRIKSHRATLKNKIDDLARELSQLEQQLKDVSPARKRPNATPAALSFPRNVSYAYSRDKMVFAKLEDGAHMAYPATNINPRTEAAIGGKVALIPGETQRLVVIDQSGNATIIAQGKNVDVLQAIKSQVSPSAPVSATGKAAEAGNTANARRIDAFKKKYGVTVGDNVRVTTEDGTVIEGLLEHNPKRVRQGTEWTVGGEPIAPRTRLKVEPLAPKPLSETSPYLETPRDRMETAMRSSVSSMSEPAVASPAMPQGKVPTVRFEAGKKLTKEERKKVLDSIGDSYYDLGNEKVLKGMSRNDEEIWGFPYSPEHMHTSDITGRKMRFWIKLPDGRMAHPSELFPEITDRDIVAHIESVKRLEKRDADFLNEARPSWEAAKASNLSDALNAWASGRAKWQTSPESMDWVVSPDKLQVARIPVRLQDGSKTRHLELAEAEGWGIASSEDIARFRGVTTPAVPPSPPAPPVSPKAETPAIPEAPQPAKGTPQGDAPYTFPKAAVWVQTGDVPPRSVQVRIAGSPGTVHWDKPLPRFIVAENEVYDTSIPIVSGDLTGQARLVKLGRNDDAYEVARQLRDGTRQPEYAFPEKAQRAIDKHKADTAQKATDAASRAEFEKNWPDIERREKMLDAEIARQFVAKNPGVAKYSPDDIAAAVRDRDYFAGVIDGNFTVISPSGQPVFRAPLGDFKVPDKGGNWLETDEQLDAVLKNIPGYKPPQPAKGVEGLADKLAQRKARLEDELAKAPKAIKGKQAGMTWNPERAVKEVDLFLTSAAESALRKGISLKNAIQERLMAEGRDAEDLAAIEKALPKFAEDLGLDDDFVYGVKAANPTAGDVTGLPDVVTDASRIQRGRMPTEAPAQSAEKLAKTGVPAYQKDTAAAKRMVEASAADGGPVMTAEQTAVAAAYARDVTTKLAQAEARAADEALSMAERQAAAGEAAALELELTTIEDAAQKVKTQFHDLGEALQILLTPKYDFVSMKNRAITAQLGKSLTDIQTEALRNISGEAARTSTELEKAKAALAKKNAGVLLNDDPAAKKALGEWERAFLDLETKKAYLSQVRKDTRSSNAKIKRLEKRIAEAEAKLGDAQVKLDDAQAAAPTRTRRASATPPSVITKLRKDGISILQRMGVYKGTAPETGGFRSKRQGAINIPGIDTETKAAKVATGLRKMLRAEVEKAHSAGKALTVEEGIRILTDDPDMMLTGDQIMSLLSGEYKVKAVAADLAKMRGDRFIRAVKAQAEWDKLDMPVKAAKVVGDIIFQLPRSLKFTADISAPMIQGFKAATGGYLPQWLRAWKPLAKSVAGGEQAYMRTWQAIEKSPDYAKAVKAKLSFTDPHAMERAEEQFRSGVVDAMLKVPGLSIPAEVVKRSEYAYSSFLNTLRMEMFEKMSAGVNDADALNDIAALINVITWRADVPQKLAPAIDTLAKVVITPRGYLSQAQELVGQPLLRAKTGEGRAQAAKYYANRVIKLGGIAGLASLLGWEFDRDPRSQRFGYLRHRKSGVDFNLVADELQWARSVVQTMYGAVNTKGAYRKPSPFQESPMVRTISGKMVPTIKAGADVFFGQGQVYNFTTEETEQVSLKDPKGLAAWYGKQYLPMGAEKVVSATTSDLPPGDVQYHLASALLDFFGVRTSKTAPVKMKDRRKMERPPALKWGAHGAISGTPIWEKKGR